MKFVLTIDTEADNQWDHGCELSLKNIHFIPRLQELCNKYGIRPTYLVTSEVCDDSFAKEIFKEYLVNNIAEVGAHLHSWSSPPFLDEEGYRYNDKNHAFATELPFGMLCEKIKGLTDQIENSFGVRPISFRSGRYGFDERVAQVLAENYYLVDSSVTPYVSWSKHFGIPGAKGGPDFMGIGPTPYKYILGDNSLVEIPITILPTKFPLNKSKYLAELYFRNVNSNLPLKLLRKIYFKNQPLWLRPYNWMNIGLFESLIKESQVLKLPCLVMMFHSSELMPGSSRNFSDNIEIENLYDLLEKFFKLLLDMNILSATLSETAKAIEL
jgi:hypothetical protein